MNYYIFIDDEPFTGPVSNSDKSYLEKALTHLQPMSYSEYFSGADVILSTAARFSYVLDGDNLLWCIEWEPGFIVIMLSPDGQISAVAVRALNPEFSGREATEAELDVFYEFYEDNDPQYNLIFDPWDAQFDKDYLASGNYTVASKSETNAFLAAINKIETLRQDGIENPDFETSKLNISNWAKNGIRIDL